MILPLAILLVVAFAHAEARPSDDDSNGFRGLNQDDFDRAKMTRRKTTFNEARDMFRDDKFEGDVGIPLNALSADGKLRNGLKDRSKRWPQGRIPYELDPSFDAEDRAEIAAAMDGIMQKTCITFKTRDRSDTSWVRIINDNGCWTYVGNVGGEQPLHLGGGCNNRGTITHELMHDIGFWHEQSRADRDDYIDIKWENVMSGLESQFRKETLDVIDHLNTRYDYLSIMHYPKWAFSKNGEDTIVPKDPNADIEFKYELSANDALKINRLYDCE